MNDVALLLTAIVGLATIFTALWFFLIPNARRSGDANTGNVRRRQGKTRITKKNATSTVERSSLRPYRVLLSRKKKHSNIYTGNITTEEEEDDDEIREARKKGKKALKKVMKRRERERRRQAREAAEESKQDAKSAKDEKYRKKIEERERARVEKEEALKQAMKEKEEQERKEYEAMKSMFEVEESGTWCFGSFALVHTMNANDTQVRPSTRRQR